MGDLAMSPSPIGFGDLGRAHALIRVRLRGRQGGEMIGVRRVVREEGTDGEAGRKAKVGTAHTTSIVLHAHPPFSVFGRLHFGRLQEWIGMLSLRRWRLGRLQLRLLRRPRKRR